jgi:membrane protein YdbS with pleckstrin-like domain
MDKGTRQFLRFLVIPLLLILVITIMLIFMGYSSVAGLVSQGGTILVVLVALVHVVFFDSKSRWPEQTTFQRFMNVMTFKR